MKHTNAGEKSTKKIIAGFRRASTLATVGAVVTLASSLVRGLVVPSILGVSGFGLWQTIVLLQSYSLYGDLGRVRAMAKSIAANGGRPEQWQDDEKRIVQSNTFIGSLATATLIGLVAVVVSLFARGENRSFYQIALPLTGLFIVLNMGMFYHTQLFRSELKFGRVITSQIASTVSGLALVIPFVYFWGTIGAVMATTASMALTVVLQVSIAGLPPIRKISWSHQIQLVKVGLPLAAIPVLIVLLSTIDRLFVVAFLSVEGLGYYGLATVIGRFVYFVPEAIGNTLLPFLLSTKRDSTQSTSNLLTSARTMVGSSLFMAIAAAILMIGTYPTLKYILPDYVPAETVILILLPSSVFIGMFFIASNVLISEDQERLSIKIQVIAILMAVIFNGSAVAMGYGLEGIATATAATNLAIGAAGSYFALTKSGASPRVGLALIGMILLSIATILITATILVISIETSRTSVLTNNVVNLAIQIPVLVVVSGLVFLAVRRFNSYLETNI